MATMQKTKRRVKRQDDRIDRIYRVRINTGITHQTYVGVARGVAEAESLALKAAKRDGFDGLLEAAGVQEIGLRSF